MATEAQSQIALFDLLARLEGRYPLLRYVHHCASESAGGQKVRRSYTKRDGTTGHKMVPMDVLRDARMGSKPGVHDVLIFCRNRCAVAGFPPRYFVGATAELKTMTGRVSADQARWTRHLTDEGWYCLECRDWCDAARLIIPWCGGDLRDVEGL